MDVFVRLIVEVHYTEALGRQIGALTARVGTDYLKHVPPAELICCCFCCGFDLRKIL